MKRAYFLPVSIDVLVAWLEFETRDVEHRSFGGNDYQLVVRPAVFTYHPGSQAKGKIEAKRIRAGEQVAQRTQEELNLMAEEELARWVRLNLAGWQTAVVFALSDAGDEYVMCDVESDEALLEPYLEGLLAKMQERWSSPRVQARREAAGAQAERAGGVREPAEQHVFRQEGEYWTVVFEGKATRIRDAKGMRHLTCLLRHPGQELHVAFLAAATEHAFGGDTAGDGMFRQAPTEGMHVARAAKSEPLIDRQAHDQYRQRLSDLSREIETARLLEDDDLEKRLERERDALLKELKATTGLHGRPRRFASEVEQARINTTKQIHAAIKRIARNDPVVGQHLANSIRTGTFCSYSPDRPVPWCW